MARAIGWYVHHHGRGHLTRAAAVARHVRGNVTMLSSLAPPVGDGDDGPGSPPPTDATWIGLDRDDAAASVLDPTARGRLHWAPVGDAGLRARMGAIAAWIAEARPSVLVVDVSVEVTMLARLFGIPVIVVAGPGDRRDAAHQLAYGVAERIIAPWPQEVYDPDFLHPHADKTVYVGAISRFDGRHAHPGPDRGVLVLAGAGGTAMTDDDVARARSAVPGRRWSTLGFGRSGWTDDVWPQLAAAGVVVTHGGQNALAEVAAARRPSVVVPQDRPFGEQAHVAAALRRHDIAAVAPGWPAANQWPRLVDAALALGGDRWARWSSGHGAQDAAAVVDAVAGGRWVSGTGVNTAVITLVRGRPGHLRGQIDGLRAARPGPDRYVVVALGDPGIRAEVEHGGLNHLVVDAVVGADEDLPLAAARNLGAAAAMAAGADLLVFLDVDCIPAPALLARYQAAAGDPRHRGSLLCGPVAYLPPPGPAGYARADLPRLARPHPSRPDPDDGAVVVAGDRRLFWSLSFAVTAPTWNRIGGFCPDYRGYGGEDTDFVETAAAAGVGMRWVGGALAFHQHHAVSTPPVEHVEAIIRNAHVFHRRWGWWPMTGWLTQFADLGLAHFDSAHGWTVTAP